MHCALPILSIAFPQQCSLLRNCTHMNVAVKVFHNDTWAEALMLMYGVRGERRRIDERKQRGSKRQVRQEEEKEQVEKRDFGDEATNHGED